MCHVRNWTLGFIILASSLAWSQSSNSVQPQPGDNNSAQPTGVPTAGGSATAAAPSANAADSTRLEVITKEKADYPLAAAEKGIQGEVWVKVLISETGDVENAEVVSGDPILADSALKASRKFKFKPFIKNGKPVKVATKMPFDFYFKDKVIDKGVSADKTATSDSSGLTPSTESSVPQRVRVAQGIAQGMLIRQVAPVYPRAARQNGVQGTVVMNAIIGKDGTLQKLTPVSGPPELVAAAVGAVQQWRYKPYMLNGQAVEVETIITVNFQLGRR